MPGKKTVGDIEQLPVGVGTPTPEQVDEVLESAEPLQGEVVQRTVGIMPGEPGYDRPVQSNLANLGGGLSVAVPMSDFAAGFGDVFGEIDDLPISTSKFKIVKLAQGMSEAVALTGEARPGDWLLEGHDPVRSFEFMPLTAEQMRQLWVANENDPNGRNTLQCKSQRRVMRKVEPELFGEGDPGGPCRLCPLSQWTPGPNGKNRPPLCTPIDILIGVSLTHECRCEIHFKKTAQPMFQEIMTIVRSRGLGAAIFNFTQAPKQNAAKQTYWVPQVNVMTDVTQDMVTKGGNIARLEMQAMGY
jgi:hypothetical protein